MIRSSISCVALGCLLAACSADSKSSPFLTTPTDAGGAGGTEGGGAGTGGPDSSVPADALTDQKKDDVWMSLDVAPPDTNLPETTILGDGPVCSATSFIGKPWPVDIYIMMDQSGSMTEELPSQPTTKWEALTQGLKSFFEIQPEDAEIGVGIQFFPLPVTPWSSMTECPGGNECSSQELCTGAAGSQYCFKKCKPADTSTCTSSQDCYVFGPGEQPGTVRAACTNDSCDSASYATPEIAVGPLATTKDQVVGAMSKHKPSMNTPLSPALAGALQYAANHANQHQDRRVVVVLATDGYPSVCLPEKGQPDTGVAQAQEHAEGAFKGTPSIPTFVIGVAGEEDTATSDFLNMIAKSGGTDLAMIIREDEDVAKTFTEALDAIRSKTMGCDYQIPTPEAGKPDYGKVNLLVSQSISGDQVVLFAGSAELCDDKLGGWFYNTDPAEEDPSLITLCPATCAQLQSPGQTSKVDIQIGCETQILPPK